MMGKSNPRFLVLLAPAFLLAACCPTITVVPHAISCDASAELLAGKCAAPREIDNSDTFSSIIDAMRSDRQALKECGIALDALRDSINRCNLATNEFNKKIDQINSSNKKSAP